MTELDSAARCIRGDRVELSKSRGLRRDPLGRHQRAHSADWTRTCTAFSNAKKSQALVRDRRGRRGDRVRPIKAALESSLYIQPLDYGLTWDEIVEIGARVGLQPGELEDALAEATGPAQWGGPRYKPVVNVPWAQFLYCEEPEYRNVATFDFVCSELKKVVRSQGARNASLDRSVLTARGEAMGLPRIDLEATITILVLTGHLTDKEGVIRFVTGREHYRLASEQLGQSQIGSRINAQPEKVEARARTHALVKDVIARRSDGRPPSAEPLEAFSAELEKLGYGEFRLWWMQILAELRRSDPSVSPVSTAVLAAALVEGALTFVVRHARTLGLPVLGSKDFNRPPQTWKIDDLVASAAAGQNTAILDANTRSRAQDLIRIRQRIHPGRMLADFPQGVPDLRPEEAREAKEVANLVVRRVCDWLGRYPPP